MIEPTINALGLQLWGIELISQGRHSLLRIFIENESGVSIEDCERTSRQVSALLDVEDPISGEYTLEVSSPGADRRLFSLDQCREFIGEEVNVRLRTPIENRRKFKGNLIEVTGSEIVIEQDGEQHRCLFELIEKANIVF